MTGRDRWRRAAQIADDDALYDRPRTSRQWSAYFFAPAWYFINRFSPTVWSFLSPTSSPSG